MHHLPNTRPKHYHAPFPAGQGVIIFPAWGREIDILVSKIDYIYKDSDEDLVISLHGNRKFYDKNLNVTVIKDMRLRALRGEIARYEEYNEAGLRIDGSPLVIMEDYDAKAKLAQARKTARQAMKLDGASAKEGGGNSAETIEPPIDVEEQAVEHDGVVPLPELEGASVRNAITSPAVTVSGADRDVDDIADLYEIGQLVEGKGVYVGTYIHNWSEGFWKSQQLSRVFDVYAAPKDIANGKTYGNLIDEIAGLVSLEGHSGARIETEERLFRALQDEEVEKIVSQWFMPPYEILDKYIHANRGQGVLKDTFNRSEDRSPFRKSFYAALRVDGNQPLRALSFRNGIASTISPAINISARPVRFELRR